MLLDFEFIKMCHGCCLNQCKSSWRVTNFPVTSFLPDFSIPERKCEVKCESWLFKTDHYFWSFGQNIAFVPQANDTQWNECLDEMVSLPFRGHTQWTESCMSFLWTKLKEIKAICPLAWHENMKSVCCTRTT